MTSPAYPYPEMGDPVIVVPTGPAGPQGPPGPSGTGDVSSVFGRTGDVAATSGDYSVDEVTGAAPLASPVFTGTPEAPTPLTADDTTALATTAFVKNVLASGYVDTSTGQTISGVKSFLAQLVAKGGLGYAVLLLNDVSLSITDANALVAVNSLSAARSLTLPSGNTSGTGVQNNFIIIDPQQLVTASHTISVIPNGIDTINGVNATTVALNAAGQMTMLSVRTVQATGRL